MNQFSLKNKFINSKKLHLTNTLLYIALLGIGAMSSAQAASNIIEAITYGQASGQLRYRFEHLDQDGINKAAKASTLRTQLGYTTDNYLGFIAFAQLENVTVIGNELYNNTENGMTQYPVVADPDGTEINQAWLSYETPYSTTLKYGRQGINLDNQRLVGTVNFRQNEQTFDAFSLVNTSLPDTTLFYAHVNNVNRIFGNDHPNPLLANTRTDTDLINLGYKGLGIGTLTGYAYLLDFEKLPLASHKDLGLRLDGTRKLKGNMKLLYTAEYANQSDYADGADTIDADYALASLGVEFKGIQLRANYELLSGDGVYAFQTPFATLHAFNGWADRFLVTPRDGIQDIFVSAGKTFYGINLLAIYHDYSSDNLDYDFGTEWNLAASKKVNKYFTVKAEYASFNADRNIQNVARNIGARSIQTQDAQIVWLTADLQF
ncbi:MAG: alginate export family protein [Gammaproteobacteria bacterium]